MKRNAVFISMSVVAVCFIVFFSPCRGNGAGGRLPRIVSLAPSVTESLFAMGFGDAVVGVTDFDLYPENVLALPKVGGFYDPSLERVLALEPGLVIGIKTFHSELLQRLETLGIRSLPLVMHRRFGDVRLAMDRLAGELGRPEEAETAWRKILEELEEAKCVLKGVFEDHPPTVMVVVWHDPLTIAGGYNYIDDILDEIGLPNAAEDMRYTFPVIDREGLIVRNPDILIVAAATTGMTFSAEDLGSVLEGLPVKAVEKARIVEVSADSLFHPGPRAAEAAAELVDAVIRVAGGERRREEEKILH